MHWQSQIRQRSLRMAGFRMPTGSLRRPHTTLVLPVGGFLTEGRMVFGKLQVLQIRPLTVQTVVTPSVSVFRDPPGILRQVTCTSLTACWTTVANTAFIGPLLRTATTAPTAWASTTMALSTLLATTTGHSAIQSVASKNNYL